MPISASFNDYALVSTTPVIKDGKYFLTVEHPSTGNHRNVRWYSDTEYSRAFSSRETDHTTGNSKLKHARGFDNGPILVIRNNKPADDLILRQMPVKYATGIGWYLPSTEIFPQNMPPHFKFLLLGWHEFHCGDGIHAKKPAQLIALLEKKALRNEWFNICGH